MEICGVVPPVLDRGKAAETAVTSPDTLALIVTVPVPPDPEELIVIRVPATIEVTPAPPPPPEADNTPSKDTLKPVPMIRGPLGPLREKVSG
jgi:hypothetical protein